MDLKDYALLADSNADGGGKAVSLSCSICLDAVTNNGERSWAKLQCGHQFHLDCIGSAFNMKGAMQCPNCRKTEHGQWLYASGCRPFPEFSMDEWAHNEDLYDLSFPEMSLGVHWCPISGLARLPSSFEEAGFLSNSYVDLAAVLSEHRAVSSASTSHPCPYLGLIQPPSGGSVSDGSNFFSQWNGHQVPIWEHHFSLFPIISTGSGSDGGQSSNPFMAQRATRLSSDEQISRSILYPSFLVAPSSAARGGCPAAVSSSMIPPYPGSVDRSRNRMQALQAYFQPPSNLPSTQTSHVIGRSSSAAQVGPSASSGRQAGNPVSNHFQPWEREHLTSFLLGHQPNTERGWCPFHHNAAGGSDIGIRSAGGYSDIANPTERGFR